MRHFLIYAPNDDSNYAIDVIKYFLFQACFIMSVLTVWARTDIFSIVYCICLIMALFLRKRSSLYRYALCMYIFSIAVRPSVVGYFLHFGNFVV